MRSPVSLHPAVRRALNLVAISAIGVGSLAACGDDDKVASTTTELAPEDVKVPMADVLAGLPTMVDHGNAAATSGATGGYTAALAEYEELHEIWEDVEGTVKDTDESIYERIETALALIKDGAENDNAERIQRGADAQSDAVDEFTDAHA